MTQNTRINDMLLNPFIFGKPLPEILRLEPGIAGSQIADSSGNSNTMTATAGVTVVSDVSWLGYTPMRFTSGGYLTASGSRLALGTQDWCLRGWFCASQLTNTRHVLYDSRNGVDGAGLLLYLNSSGELRARLNTQASGELVATMVYAGQWNYFQLNCVSGIATLYLNNYTPAGPGNSAVSAYTRASSYGQTVAHIGASAGGADPFFGYLPALSLSVGSVGYEYRMIAFSANPAGYLGSLANDALTLAGLAKLAPNYTGPLITIRRSNDNGFQDFGMLPDGTLDWPALTAYAGSYDAHVYNLYDQTGNNRYWRQNTYARQPRVVVAGAYFGRIRFDGTDDVMASTSLPSTANGRTQAAQYRPRALGDGSYAQGVISGDLSIVPNNHPGLFYTNSAYSNYLYDASSGTAYYRESRHGTPTLDEVTQVITTTPPTLAGLKLFQAGAESPRTGYYESTPGPSNATITSGAAHIGGIDRNTYVGNPAPIDIGWVGVWNTDQSAANAAALSAVSIPATPGAAYWPQLPDENTTFNDEGTATTGWTPSNGSLSISTSYLRLTKTASGSSSIMSKALTFTPNNRDWILYGKARASNTTGASAAIWLLNGSKEAALWFGTTNAGQSLTTGAVSLAGFTGSSTRNVAQVGTGIAYDTTPVEFALQFDSKFAQLVCWFRDAGGVWRYKARVACDWFSSANISCVLGSGAAAGTWIEFDYLTLCRPNAVAIGDSLCAGATGFNPDRTLGLADDGSTWQRYANIYPSNRNSLIVNKGVGSQTSTMIKDRIAEATGEGARVVLLHASSNDSALGVSLATRTQNIQTCLDAITASGALPVLLNSMYGTSSYAGQPGSLRDYNKTWWDVHRPTLTGNFRYLDIMQPLKAADNYMDAGVTRSDGIHPTNTGYSIIGAFIKAASGV